MNNFNIKKYIVFLTLLVLIDCGIGAFIGVWREVYWGALSDKNLHLWIKYIIEFVVAALISCGVSGYSQYLIGIISLNIRTKLTKKAMQKDFSHIEGHQQRIQEDCFSYPTLLLNLTVILFRSIIMIVAFSIIILMHMEWYYLLIPVVYALIGTLVAGKIALPLINLNYYNQVFEAQFRQRLDRISYILAHRNNKTLFRKMKHLQYFQSFFQQITVIFPHLVLAASFFSGKIVFGVFMQIAAAMTEITNSLSVVILSLSDINNFLSCRRRLRELGLI